MQFAVRETWPVSRQLSYDVPQDIHTNIFLHFNRCCVIAGRIVKELSAHLHACP
jgi:hypothetical protein